MNLKRQKELEEARDTLSSFLQLLQSKADHSLNENPALYVGPPLQIVLANSISKVLPALERLLEIQRFPMPDFLKAEMCANPYIVELG